MARLLKSHRKMLREIRALMCMTPGDSNFSRQHVAEDSFDDPPLPKCEAEVNEFIRRRTRRWREAWILRVLDEIIERAEEGLVSGSGR